MITQENNFRIDLVKSSDDFCQIYSKEDFSINATTKEQYLAFKQYIKQAKYGHHVYVAYYMFKHRIGCDFQNEELVDNLALHAWLDSEIICRCWNMLWYAKNPYTYGGGEGCMKYEAIPNFKKKVISIYNKFAENNFEIIDNEVKLK
jgi:hypothetical protein